MMDNQLIKDFYDALDILWRKYDENKGFTQIKILESFNWMEGNKAEIIWILDIKKEIK